MNMRHLLPLGAGAACLWLAGCTMPPPAEAPAPAAAAAADAPGAAGTGAPDPRPADPAPAGAERPAAAREAEPAPVDAAGGAAGVLGRTVASLGDPAATGLWLATPLVDAPRPGHVRPVAGGAAIAVELRPTGGSPGSGSRLSLAGFQSLGLPVTALPELEVSAP